MDCQSIILLVKRHKVICQLPVLYTKTVISYTVTLKSDKNSSTGSIPFCQPALVYCMFPYTQFIENNATIKQLFCFVQIGTRRSKKRKILKADQLLLPEPFFKPVGSKKRKINKKIQRKRTEGGSDCESSGTEEEAWGTSRRKTKKIPSDPDKHVASYDLWATEGMGRKTL